MIAGKVIGIQWIEPREKRPSNLDYSHLDLIRIVVETEDGRESTLDVYPCLDAARLHPGNSSVWTQCGMVMANGAWFEKPDTKLWIIRTDWDGYRWTLEEAMQGGRKILAR